MARREAPPFPPYIEAREYLDDLIQRRQASLRIYQVGDDLEPPLWVAHIEWNDGHPVHPIIGYTLTGRTQGEAIMRLAKAARDDRENVR